MEFMTVALVHLLAVASPGPISRWWCASVAAQGRRAGSWTALGVGCGIFVHVAYSLLGIGLIVSQSIVLFNLFKWLAAACLVYLGWRALRARPMSLEAIDGANAPVARSAWRAFVIGFSPMA